MIKQIEKLMEDVKHVGHGIRILEEEGKFTVQARMEIRKYDEKDICYDEYFEWQDLLKTDEEQHVYLYISGMYKTIELW